MLTVACVLKSGGIYDGEWVRILQASVARNLSYEHRFVCLTDMDVDCESIAFENDWPGWWSKIELFRPELFEDAVLYLDLDTVIVGNIDELPVGRGFCTVRDYSGKGICTTAMAWRDDLSAIYRRFWAEPRFQMDRFRYWENGNIGDQGFIYETLHAPAIQCWPRKWVASFKHHCRGGLPDEAKVVAFHGQPKCNEVHDEWVKQNWRADLEPA